MAKQCKHAYGDKEGAQVGPARQVADREASGCRDEPSSRDSGLRGPPREAGLGGLCDHCDITLSSTQHTDPSPLAVNGVVCVSATRWCFSVNTREGHERHIDHINVAHISRARVRVRRAEVVTTRSCSRSFGMPCNCHPGRCECQPGFGIW
eukprot:1175363-Prorocentrum_minimum.AAC.6